MPLAWWWRMYWPWTALFNGRRWVAEIYPIVKDHIRLSELSIS